MHHRKGQGPPCAGGFSVPDPILGVFMFLSRQLGRDGERRGKVGREGEKDQGSYSPQKSFYVAWKCFIMYTCFHPLTQIPCHQPHCPGSSMQLTPIISPVNAAPLKHDKLKAVVLNQGHFCPPCLPEDIWQCPKTFLMSRLREMLLVGSGQGCRWISYNAQDTQQRISTLCTLSL